MQVKWIIKHFKERISRS